MDTQKRKRGRPRKNPVPPNAQADGALVQETQGSVETDTVPRTELNYVLKELDAMKARLDASERTGGLRVMTGVAMGKSDADIEKFLNEKRPDDEIFSASRGYLVVLVGNQGVWNDSLKQEVVIPALVLKFKAWKGVGAELKNPEKPERSLFEWGRARLSELEGVKNGTHTVEQAREALYKNKLFKQGLIFLSEVAQEHLRAEYASRAAIAKVHAEATKRIEQVTANAAKAGRAVADDGMVPVGAGVGVAGEA